MSEQHIKNKRTILILFSMTIIPFIIAWFLSGNINWIGRGTNNGELIIPPVTTQTNEFVGFDPFSINNMAELKGHWVLINVIAKDECTNICQESIHKTKQLRLMMNKDLTRIRRLVIILSAFKPSESQMWWKNDTRLIKAKVKATLLTKLSEIRPVDIPEGMLFLMDPLGNLMMQYEPGFDVYQVKQDLARLLRISQIG